MLPLLVIVPDRLSDIISKGELQPNYYNPGCIFGEVHILMCNDDRPDKTALQYLVGNARLTLHNLPDDLELVGRRPHLMTRWRLRKWAAPGVALARRIRPALIRCHGADWNTYLASRIKAELGVPYVVSLHINADVNPVRRFTSSALTPAQQRHNRFYHYIESEGLRNAGPAVYSRAERGMARRPVSAPDVGPPRGHAIERAREGRRRRTFPGSMRAGEGP